LLLGYPEIKGIQNPLLLGYPEIKGIQNPLLLGYPVTGRERKP